MVGVNVVGDASDRADVTAFAVTTGGVVAIAASAFTGLRWQHLSWLDRTALIGRDSGVEALALLAAALVVCFGSNDERLSPVGHVTLALIGVAAAALIAGSIAAAWSYGTEFGGGWGLRLQFIADPAAAAVPAGVAVWFSVVGLTQAIRIGAEGDASDGADEPTPVRPVE
jgi:hypothetical protein